MVIVGQGDIKYLFWVFGMTQLWIESWSPRTIGKPSNFYANRLSAPSVLMFIHSWRRRVRFIPVIDVTVTYQMLNVYCLTCQVTICRGPSMHVPILCSRLICIRGQTGVVKTRWTEMGRLDFLSTSVRTVELWLRG